MLKYVIIISEKFMFVFLKKRNKLKKTYYKNKNITDNIKYY